ncbi:helix-turn-helix transcriptional regulator [Companilactobacillus formosensis]|uniref:helix-turn-helix transcriptional regulator n=1 Tax=Companilactobacillus formosensis TaxID=1617889 RepID=UPI0013C32B51|nr:WYL domain-containing protein [Companilactobacillus formosensis]
MNLSIEVFLQLLENEACQTKDIAAKQEITIRTAQRAIKEIKVAFDKSAVLNKYFQLKKIGHAYSINQRYLLNQNQVLILIASRSLNSTELPRLTNKMLDMLTLEERSVVSDSVMTERITDNYLTDESFRIEKMGQLEQYIYHKQKIRFVYTDRYPSEDPNIETIEMLPIHTFFDNLYFFLIGLVKDTHEYRTFRIDWMDNIEPIHFKLPIDHSKYHDHGQETRYEAFGYQGKKTRIQFEYYGYLEYIKDIFPSCKVIKTIDKPNRFNFSVKILEIEVNYSDGIKLWLLGETTILRVLSPKSIADDIRDTLREGYERYLE